jgi:transposase
MESLFVGVDVSKDYFCVSGLDIQGQVRFSLTATADQTGFTEMLNTITSHCASLDEVMVAMESSGCYHLNLFSVLTANHIRTVVVNPLLIANYGKLSLRKTKTDKKDALVIAHYLWSHRETILQYSVSQDYQDIRDVAREREFTGKMIAGIKNDIKRMLQSTFPELEKLVNVFSDTMLHFLKTFPSARLIASTGEKELRQAFIHPDKRMRLVVKPEKIREAALTSVASTGLAKEMLLPGKIETLIHLQQRLGELTTLMVRLCKATLEEELKIITSIDGINTKTAAPFLAELGDLSNYKSYKKVIAFAGVDPSIHQSGKFQGNSKISKRGNRHLRRVIYLMTFCAIRMEGPFKQYFQKRKNEGLPFRKALFATAHKLIRVIFTMLQKRTYFMVNQTAL